MTGVLGESGLAVTRTKPMGQCSREYAHQQDRAAERHDGANYRLNNIIISGIDPAKRYSSYASPAVPDGLRRADARAGTYGYYIVTYRHQEAAEESDQRSSDHER